MEGGICRLPLGVKSLRVAPLSRRVPHGDGDDDVAARADPRAAAASETPSADDARAESASASRGAAKCRRVGDDGGADNDAESDVPSRATTTATVSSNPFTIAAGASKPPASSFARRRLAAPPRLERGDYVLPDGASFLRYDPGALAARCTRQAYDELWAVSRDVPPTPNPLNRHTNIKRKQGTFGAAYAFGAQKRARLDGPNGVLGSRFANEDDWPSLVRLCVEDARRRVAPGFGGADAFGPLRAAAHVNWYPDGTAGMGRHATPSPAWCAARALLLRLPQRRPPEVAGVFDLYADERRAPAGDGPRTAVRARVPLAHGARASCRRPVPCRRVRARRARDGGQGARLRPADQRTDARARPTEDEKR